MVVEIGSSICLDCQLTINNEELYQAITIGTNMVYDKNKLVMVLLLMMGLLVIVPTTMFVAHAYGQQSEEAEEIMKEIIENIHNSNFSRTNFNSQ